MNYKTCSICKKELPITSEYFNKNKNVKDGFENRCKKCKKEEAKQKTLLNKTKEIIFDSNATQICKKCGIEKPLTKEYYTFRNDSQKFRTECNDCKKGYNKQYREQNVFKYVDKEYIGYDTTKVCYNCKQEFPFNQDYFYRDISNTSGLSHECKQCANNRRDKRVEEYKKIHTENFFDNLDETQLCCICHKEYKLNTNNFYKDITRRTGFSNQCKSCTTKHRSNFYITPAKYISKPFKELQKYIEHRRNPNNAELGQVKCIYCNNWFTPTNGQVYDRLDAINNKTGGQNLYCSDNCKNLCPIYRQEKYPKDLKPIRQEVPLWLKDAVKEMHDYHCYRCGQKFDERDLVTHHLEPYVVMPQLAMDINNIVPLCVECHKQAHQKDGCRLGQLHTECYMPLRND